MLRNVITTISTHFHVFIVKQPLGTVYVLKLGGGWEEAEGEAGGGWGDGVQFITLICWGGKL